MNASGLKDKSTICFLDVGIAEYHKFSSGSPLNFHIQYRVSLEKIL